MTLRIGIKSRSRGFTLIEILLTVSIVALAAVFITQANLLSAAVYGRYVNRLEVQNFAAKKLWEIKESILGAEFPDTGSSRGNFQGATRSYQWKAEIDEEQQKLSELYKIRLEVLWREGGGENRLERYGALVRVKGQ